MKKNIVFSMLLILTATSFGRQADPPKKFSKEDYLLKSKHQNTAAWILLGGGIVVAGIGVVIGSQSVADELFTGDSGGFDAVAILVPAGLISMAGSIPLFIASSRNKRKGMKLSFKNETAPQIQKSSFVYRLVPSLTLKISL